MIRSEARAYINVGALVAALVVNYLANALPINGLTQGQLSELYPVLITPAGYVFSIWGLIYLALTAFTVYQALPRYRENPVVKAVGLLFALSCLLNISWVFFWHYQQVGISLVIMLLFLATLVIIYLRIGAVSAQRSFYDRLLVRYPFSLYLGWISAAAIVNLNVFLYHLGWLGTTGAAVPVTMVFVIIAALVAVAVFYLRQDYIYAAVFVWALAGIGVRHGGGPVVLSVASWLAAAGIVFCLGRLTARSSLRNR